MNFPFYIAKRYLVSKKTQNVVNVISTIAIAGVTFGTAALVIILSGFNGLGNLVQSLFSSFDPQLKITIVEGKQFDPNTEAFNQIRNHEAVAFFSEVLEETAMLRYDDYQYICTVKGVDSNFVKMSGLDTLITDGKFVLNSKGFNYAVIGQGVSDALNAGVNFVRSIDIYVIKKGRKGLNAIYSPYSHDYIFLGGVFAVSSEIDAQYAIVPLNFARKLFDIKSNVSAIEIGLKPGVDIKIAQQQIATILGSNYDVKNRYEQHESYFKIMKSEKLIIFTILCFILIIASFNQVSSVTMLILDKKRDILILESMGATRNQIEKIFFYEGWLIALIGSSIGLILGVLICLGQMHFGWIKFPGSFVVEVYPVQIEIINLIEIIATVLVIGLFASWLPIKLLRKQLNKSNY